MKSKFVLDYCLELFHFSIGEFVLLICIWSDCQEFEDTCIQVGKGFDGKSILYRGNFLSAENITRRVRTFLETMVVLKKWDEL